MLQKHLPTKLKPLYSVLRIPISLQAATRELRVELLLACHASRLLQVWESSSPFGSLDQMLGGSPDADARSIRVRTVPPCIEEEQGRACLANPGDGGETETRGHAAGA